MDRRVPKFIGIVSASHVPPRPNLRLEARRLGGSEARKKHKKRAAAKNSEREQYMFKTALKVRKLRRLKEGRKQT